MKKKIKKMQAGKTIGKAVVLSMALTLGAAPVAGIKAADSSALYVGDVNQDGEISAKDVTSLRRYLAGGWGVEVTTEDSDLNQDGEVNAKDVTMLRRYLAGGWGVELPLKQATAHLGTMRAEYGSVSYVLDEHDSNGNITKSKNFRLNDSSSTSLIKYDNDGNSYWISKGRYSKGLYDANNTWRGNISYFQDKILSGYEYTVEINGTTTTETETDYGWDKSVKGYYVYEYDNTKTAQYDDDEDYDDEYGRMIRYIRKDKTGKVLNSTEYKYDSQGRTSEYIYFDGEGNKTGYEELSYSSDGEKVTHTVKDKNGVTTSIYDLEYYTNGHKYTYKTPSGEVTSTEEYEYFENGRFKKETEKDALGEITYYREYDSQGRQIRFISGTYADYENIYNDITGSVTVVSISKDEKTKTEYSFDEKAGTMMAKYMDEKGNLISYEVGEYDSDANLIKLTRYDSNNQVTGSNEFTYDAIGMLQKKVDKDSVGTVTGSTIYKYNEYGSRIERIIYDSSNVENYKEISEYHSNGQKKKEMDVYASGYTYIYCYDENGRQIENTRIVNGVQEYSRKTEYDEKGNRVKEIEYSEGITSEISYENGKMISAVKTDEDGNTVSNTSFEYDENGYLIKEIEKDPQETIISTASYTYNENGKETSYVKEYSDGTKDTREIEYYANGEYAKRKYTYKDGRINEYEYYENGKIKYDKYVGTDGYISESQYYENGKQKASNYKYADGSYGNSTYNENGYTLVSVSYNKDGEETYRSEYEYNEEGQRTLYIWYSNGKEYSRTEYSYHENGKKAEEVCKYTSEGTKNVRKYNTLGLEESNISYDKDGNITSKTDTAYDENNKIKSKIETRSWGITETYYTDGLKSKLVNKNSDGKIYTVYSDYKYDANGRETAYTYSYYDTDTEEIESTTKYTKEYYSNGYPKTQKEEYSDGRSKITAYSEQSNERIMSEIRYNENGKKASTTEYEYDENGRKIKEHTIEADGDESIDEYTYDENGRTSTHKSTDKDSSSTSVFNYKYTYYEDGKEHTKEYSYKYTSSWYTNEEYYLDEYLTYDGWRVTSKKRTDADGVTVLYEYVFDANGRQIKETQTNPDNEVDVYEWTYDADGKVLNEKHTYPDNGVELEVTEYYDNSWTVKSSKHTYPDGIKCEEYENYENGNRKHLLEVDSEGNSSECFWAEGYKKIKEISILSVTGDDLGLSLPYRKYQSGYSEKNIKLSYVREADEVNKYAKIINYFDEKGDYKDSELYAITEDGAETLKISVSFELNENGEGIKTVWKYYNGRTYEWYFGESYDDNYEVYKEADGTIISESGKKPSFLQ